MAFLARIFISVFIISAALYAYINKMNTLTELRILKPVIAKNLKDIEEEIVRLQFEKEKFENPINLMELSRKPAYCHLKHPVYSDIITIDEAGTVQEIAPKEGVRKETKLCVKGVEEPPHGK